MTFTLLSFFIVHSSFSVRSKIHLDFTVDPIAASRSGELERPRLSNQFIFGGMYGENAHFSQP